MGQLHERINLRRSRTIPFIIRTIPSIVGNIKDNGFIDSRDDNGIVFRIPRAGDATDVCEYDSSIGVLVGIWEVYVDAIQPGRFARNRENENFRFPGLEGEIIGIGCRCVRFIFVEISPKGDWGKVTEKRPAAAIGFPDDGRYVGLIFQPSDSYGRLPS